jgi:hypothetical protein
LGNNPFIPEAPILNLHCFFLILVSPYLSGDDTVSSLQLDSAGLQAHRLLMLFQQLLPLLHKIAIYLVETLLLNEALVADFNHTLIFALSDFSHLLFSSQIHLKVAHSIAD